MCPETEAHTQIREAKKKQRNSTQKNGNRMKQKIK